MTFFEFVLKLNGKFPALRRFSQSFVKSAVLDPRKRSRLNSLYHKLSYYEKSIFHALFGRIFRDGNSYDIDGYWILKFAGQEIRIPLNGDSLWLDWETAVSVLGHDYEIKAFYEEELASSKPPNCFMDIGANYGTHSLLFLKSGIRTISIEPNPECKAYFEKMAEFNQVKGEWFGIALGEKEGKAEIVFPEGETWLGSIKEIDFSNRKESIKSYQVSVETLDRFLETNDLKPELIKIDTEGFEEGVIKGGKDYLSEKYPQVIFEANSIGEKKKLIKQFQGLGFQIFSLKINLPVRAEQMKLDRETNFLAKEN
ncbi:FkbM family methyltransferase [Algoriphagus sp. CAU 1675]|uniref:FkbM family methyltransferase n=1 Tax=Algoriphagus sp. CAU 1675 TaxID=3032597 RepID=UPI0023DB2809|nr:FkbM family methyltransferase [Algoriphagus sp. CAU 1675]MDF2159413.1 FkbM family methyltransferase [Algoriphagus sp. CAU 1675]